MQFEVGKTIPEFRPELIKAALAFMKRTQLSGEEAHTFVACVELLLALSDGSYQVTPDFEKAP